MNSTNVEVILQKFALAIAVTSFLKLKNYHCESRFGVMWQSVY